jgi:hypothetical protein
MGLRLNRYGPVLTMLVVGRFPGIGVPARRNVLIAQMNSVTAKRAISTPNGLTKPGFATSGIGCWFWEVPSAISSDNAKPTLTTWPEWFAKAFASGCRFLMWVRAGALPSGNPVRLQCDHGIGRIRGMAVIEARGRLAPGKQAPASKAFVALAFVSVVVLPSAWASDRPAVRFTPPDHNFQTHDISLVCRLGPCRWQ